MARTTKKKATEAAPAPQPDLIVSAVVTVICTPDGGASVHLKVDMDGQQALVTAMKPAEDKAKIIGAALRRTVMQALAAEPDGPVIDLLAQRRVAGRA